VSVDQLAAKLREAYADHDETLKPLTPWRSAASEKKDAWRAIARAAMRELEAA
jgi:hypothetical protein